MVYNCGENGYSTEPALIPNPENLEEIFPQSDIISLHCPLTTTTNGLINKHTIAQMKKDVCIINTARGAIVNEKDLFQALIDKKVGGAALDVFEDEPPSFDNPLFALDNVIFTPHIGGASYNSLKNMGIDATRNVLSILKGSSVDPECLLNKEVFET